MRQKCSAAGFIFSYIFSFPLIIVVIGRRGQNLVGTISKISDDIKGTETVAKLKYDLHRLEDVFALHTIPLAICKLYKLWIPPLGTLYMTVSLYHHFVKILTELHVIVSLNTKIQLI